MTKIDRHSPSQKPPQRAAMSMTWRDLLFLHWNFAPDAVQELLPNGLEVDTFDGRAFVGLVPFRMSEVRPRWLPPLGAFGRGVEAFPELNVRTYVVKNGVPGVWFFSLDCGSSLATLAARAWFGLPYFRARMRVSNLRKDAIRYESDRLWPSPKPAFCRLRYKVADEIGTAKADSLEAFLVERYVLYSRRGDQIWRGRVHHRPYELCNARVEALRENCVFQMTGLRPLDDAHVLFSRRVEVEAWALERA